MRSRQRYITAIGALSCGLLVHTAMAAAPLGSAFTYQGTLNLAGEAVNDTADFQATLFDAGAEGTQIGALVDVLAVDIVDGLFTMQLDFGVAAFDGDARWLELSVRSPAGGGDYQPVEEVALAPRGQRGTPVDARKTTSPTGGRRYIEFFNGLLRPPVTPPAADGHPLQPANAWPVRGRCRQRRHWDDESRSQASY